MDKSVSVVRSRLAKWLNDFGDLLSLDDPPSPEITKGLDEAISSAQAAILDLTESYPSQTEWKREWMHRLSMAHLRRLQCTNNAGDAASAVSAAELAHSLKTTQPDDGIWLCNLATIHLIQYETTSEIQALELAISKASEALDAAPSGGSDIKTIANLSVMYSYRYCRTNDIEDLDEAIYLGGRAMSLSAGEDPELARIFSNHAALLSQRYEQTGRLEHLEAAIKIAHKASEMSPEKVSVRSAILTNLGRMLFYKYQEDQDVQHLYQSISSFRAAIEASQTASPALLVIALSLVEDVLPKLLERTRDAKLSQEIVEEVLQRVPDDTEELKEILARIARDFADAQATEMVHTTPRSRIVDSSAISVLDHKVADGQALIPDTKSELDRAALVEADSGDAVGDGLHLDLDRFFHVTIGPEKAEDAESRESAAEKDHITLVKYFNSPDSLLDIPRHALKPREGIQGRSLTLCACCNQLTPEERLKTTLFQHNETHLQWSPGPRALVSRPYPQSHRPSIRTPTVSLRGDPRVTDKLPLSPQADVSRYIRWVFNASNAAVGSSGHTPQWNIPSALPFADLRMSPLYRTYHDRDPSYIPFPPKPAMLNPGSTHAKKPLDLTIHLQGSIIKRNHEVLPYANIRQAMNGVTLGEDYLPVSYPTAKTRTRRSNARLCRDCSKIDFSSFFKKEDPPRCWLVSPEKWIRNRYDSCSFCRFLCGAAMQHKIPLGTEEAYVPIALVSDSLISNLAKDKNQTLDSGHVTCTILPRTDCGVPCLQARLVTDDYKSNSPLMARLPARHIVDISLIQHWLSLCETRHEGICDEPPWAANHTHPESFMVVDVSTCSIIRPPKDCRYCTLSYVRGGTKLLEAALKSRPEIMEEGGLRGIWEDIPWSIRDAMRLVESMGWKYLWVDVLCLPYNDDTALRHHMGRMDAIFSRAVVMIVSAGGPDANAGLPGVWPHLRILEQIEEEVQDGIRIALPLDPARKVKDSVWDSMACTLQEKLLSRRVLIFIDDQVFWKCRCSTWFEDSIAETEETPAGFPSAHRAFKVLMECHNINEIAALHQPKDSEPFPFPVEEYSATGATYRSAISLEGAKDPGVDMMTGRYSDHDPSFSVRLTLHDHTMREQLAAVAEIVLELGPVQYTLGKHFVVSTDEEGETDATFNADPSRRDVVEFSVNGDISLSSWNFREYAMVVKEYTRRQFQEDAEVATAFAGFERALEACLGAPFLHGLPTSHFDAALLWMPSENLERRHREYGKEMSSPQETYPSWSWMGWELKVHPVVRWYVGDREANCFKLLDDFGIGMMTACQPLGKLVEPWRDDWWRPYCLYTSQPPQSGIIDVENLTLPPEPGIDQFLHFQTSACFFRLGETTIILPKPGSTEEEDSGPRWKTTPAGSEEDDIFASSIRPTAPCNRVFNSDGEWVGYVAFDNDSDRDSLAEMIVIAITPGRRQLRDEFSGYAVMAIRTGENGVAYRIGLGEVDQQAWWNASPRWTQVTLG